MSSITKKPSARPARRTAAVRFRGTIYLSAPLGLRGSREYDASLHRIRSHLPGVTILEALKYYEDVDDWRRRRAATIASTQAFVFLSLPGGMIGRGVWGDLELAQAAEIPIYYLGEGEALAPRKALSFSEPDETDWTCYVQVTAKVGG
ncbi:MAG: hypothetical protein R2910_05525 [Gemmatimonadales bacterium]